MLHFNVVRGDAIGNSLRANQFEFNRQLEQDRQTRGPQRVGDDSAHGECLLQPAGNNVNFPAGILQPPFYDYKADDAVNFGGIGAVIGHELTHGFDDEGSQFDADGNLRNWWTPKDKEQFDKLEQCFVDEYDSFVVVDDVHIKGKLTLGENTADNGGLRISHMALLDVMGITPLHEIDGFTPEQRFFLGYGQIWCQNGTPKLCVCRLYPTRTQTRNTGSMELFQTRLSSPRPSDASPVRRWSASRPAASGRRTRTTKCQGHWGAHLPVSLVLQAIS